MSSETLLSLCDPQGFASVAGFDVDVLQISFGAFDSQIIKQAMKSRALALRPRLILHMEEESIPYPIEYSLHEPSNREFVQPVEGCAHPFGVGSAAYLEKTLSDDFFLWKSVSAYNVFVYKAYAAHIEGNINGGEPLFPVDPFVCMLGTPVHTRVVDNIVPRDFLRWWYLQSNLYQTINEIHDLAYAFLRRSGLGCEDSNIPHNALPRYELSFSP